MVRTIKPANRVGQKEKPSVRKPLKFRQLGHFAIAGGVWLAGVGAVLALLGGGVEGLGWLPEQGGLVWLGDMTAGPGSREVPSEGRGVLAGWLGAGLGLALIWAGLLGVRLRRRERLVSAHIREMAIMSLLGRQLVRAQTIAEAGGMLLEAVQALFHRGTVTLLLLDTKSGKPTWRMVRDEEGRKQSFTGPWDRLETFPECHLDAVRAQGSLMARSVPAEGEGAGPLDLGGALEWGRAWMVVPLKSHGTLMGLLGVEGYSIRRFEPLHQEWLEALANHGAGTLIRLNTSQGLRASERQFHSLAESLAQGMVLIDPSGSIVQANRMLEHMTGWERWELEGRAVQEILQPVPPWPSMDDLRQSGGEPVTLAGEIECRNGDRLPVEWHAVACPAGPGHPEGVLTTLRDLTAQRRIERDLFESRERFARIFRCIPVAAVVATIEDGRVLDVNDHFLRMFGFRTVHVLGRVLEGLDIWTEEVHGKLFLELCQRHGRVREFECHMRSLTGEERTVLVSGESMEWRGGSCVLLILHDLTERVRLESGLRQSQKMECLGRLAAGVAHDFRNLLTLVRGHCSLALGESQVPREVRESLQEILNATSMASSLTQQLLAFSRRRALKVELLDLNQLVKELTTMIRVLLGAGVKLDLDLAPDLASLKADRAMMDQVIMNLAVNARDAMEGQGRLLFRTAMVECSGREHAAVGTPRPGRRICLEVADEGCGIPDELLSRIFEPFFTTKDPGQGTGLGLATVFGVVEQHLGWVEVRSVPGEGTVFRLLFAPSFQEVAPDAGGDRSGTDAKGARPFTETSLKVLLIEPDTAVRTLLQTLLSRRGYTVSTAQDAEEAKKAWSRTTAPFGLVITESRLLEGGSGLEVAGSFRAESPSIPILILSDGEGLGPGQRNHGLDRGVGVLEKPFNRHELERALGSCLRRTPSDDLESADDAGGGGDPGFPSNPFV